MPTRARRGNVIATVWLGGEGEAPTMAHGAASIGSGHRPLRPAAAAALRARWRPHRVAVAPVLLLVQLQQSDKQLVRQFLRHSIALSEPFPDHGLHSPVQRYRIVSVLFWSVISH